MIVIIFIYSLFSLQALLKKMTSSTRRGFPWGTGSLFLLLIIGAIVAYDTQKHGSFEGKNLLCIIDTNLLFVSHIVLAFIVILFLFKFCQLWYQLSNHHCLNISILNHCSGRDFTNTHCDAHNNVMYWIWLWLTGGNIHCYHKHRAQQYPRLCTTLIAQLLIHF